MMTAMILIQVLKTSVITKVHLKVIAQIRISLASKTKTVGQMDLWEAIIAVRGISREDMKVIYAIILELQQVFAQS